MWRPWYCSNLAPREATTGVDEAPAEFRLDGFPQVAPISGREAKTMEVPTELSRRVRASSSSNCVTERTAHLYQ